MDDECAAILAKEGIIQTLIELLNGRRTSRDILKSFYSHDCAKISKGSQ